MKPRLSHSVLTFLLSYLAASFTAQADCTYLAEGVKLDQLSTSERFFDNGKGYYWQDSPVYRGVSNMFNENNHDLSFLGDLTERIDNIHNLDYNSTFSHLTADSNTCWYNAASNVLQYWETYYGVFYKGTEKLPYGHNYSQSIAPRIGGTQSLRIEMPFYDNWENNGGNFFMAADWYLSGTTKDVPTGDGWAQMTGKNQGGYFKEYFPTAKSSYFQGYTYDYWGNSLTLQEITEDVLTAMGCQYSDNAVTRVTEGQIMFFGIQSDKGYGHALTCYGFTLNEEGLLKSVRVANSDDSQYTTFELYIRQTSDALYHLYSDEACTTLWEYANDSWYFSDFAGVKTSKELKRLYAEYTNQETPLTWNGKKATWSENDSGTATLERLPEETDGWDVYAGTDYYRSYYYEERPVLFNDHSASGEVGLEGALSAPKVTIDNNSTAYTFTGTDNTTLNTAKLVKSGENTALFTGVAVTAAELSVGSGKLLMGQNASLDINGEVVIRALTSDTAAGINSTNGDQTYAMGNTAIQIENASISHISKDSGTLSNRLSNVKIINNGTGTLTEDNALNLGGGSGKISAEAVSGNINFLNKGTGGMHLEEAIIGTGLTLGVYMSSETTEDSETNLFIQGRLVGFTNSTVNANLTMMTGSELDVFGTNNTGINLGSALTFNLGMTLSEADANAVGSMATDGVYHLFNGVDSFTLGSTYTDVTTSITAANAVDASAYFTNLEKGKYIITYTGASNGGANVGQVLLMSMPTPEPTTGTLSLLGLTTLCIRRRRRL